MFFSLPSWSLVTTAGSSSFQFRQQVRWQEAIRPSLRSPADAGASRLALPSWSLATSVKEDRTLCWPKSMDADRIIFQTEWIAVKQSPRGFQYLERKGKDSVAVFLLRKNGANPPQYEVLIRWQHLCIDNRETGGTFNLFPCPITGALEEGESPEAAAIREVYEETGYQVQVLPLGKYIVGTQVNEMCYLYYADVTGIEPGVAKQDGTYMESIAHNEWHPFEYLQSCDFSACPIGYLKLQNILFKKN